jgi:hypothetical protein
VQAIKEAIYTYGPISVAVYVGNAFQAYSGGIFNTNESGSVNHAVVLVGWNDDLGPDNASEFLGFILGRVRVHEDMPDLTGVFTSLYTSHSGKILYGTFQGENTGTAATAKSFRLLFYLSKDGVAKTTHRGTATISSTMPANSYIYLSIHKSSTVSFKGKYALCGVDPDNKIPESNKNNNVIVKLIQ